MARFQDIPQELIDEIAKLLGGTNLRKDVKLLTLFKKWYSSARPVYHTGSDFTRLRFSEKRVVLVNGYDQNTEDLILANTKSLRIHLIGHSWDTTGYSWQFLGDVSNLPQNQPSARWSSDPDIDRLVPWRQQLNGNIDAIGSLVSGIEHLTEFEFTASSEYDELIGPRWDYVDNAPVAKIVRGLIGQHLSTLTLDTCGSELFTYQDEEPIHICPLIARCFPTVENLRLRMRQICPDVFPRLVGDYTTYRLRSLVIKLNLPAFPDARDCPIQETHYRAVSCNTNVSRKEILHHYEDMIRSCEAFAAHFVDDQKRRFMVTYIDASSFFNVMTVNCVTGRVFSNSNCAYVSEDHGKPNWWEVNDYHQLRSMGQWHSTSPVRSV